MGEFKQNNVSHMKKLLFVLAISGLVLTSCNSTGAKSKKEEAHSHEAGCTHDHGTEGHEHHQEEFKVDSTKNGCEAGKTSCTAEEKKSCCDSKKVEDEHEGHDHDHENGDHKH